MNNELKDQLHEAIGEFLRILTPLSETQINKVPFEGSWTAGQVADHVIKFVSGSTATMYGKTDKPGRDPQKNVPVIKDTFLNFSVKFKSPDFVVPANPPHNKSALINSLNDADKNITHAVQTLDLSEICTSIPLPVVGNLTRVEWVYFDLYHVQRHIHQLKNIVDYL